MSIFLLLCVRAHTAPHALPVVASCPLASLETQGLVRISVDKFLAGTDLFRLQLQQSMAGGWVEALHRGWLVRVAGWSARLCATLLAQRDGRQSSAPAACFTCPPTHPCPSPPSC